MTKKEIFEKHLGLTCPHPFEYLHELLGLLGYSVKDYKEENTRKNVFDILEILLNLEILEIYDWIKEPTLNDLDLTKKDVLTHLDRLWLKNVEYSDFYGLVMFGGTKWYVEALENLGMTHTTNWEGFVKENMGDLEQWINDNKPTNQ